MARTNACKTPGTPSPVSPSDATPLRGEPDAGPGSTPSAPPRWEAGLPAGLLDDLRQLRSQFDKVDRVTGNIIYRLEETRKQARVEQGLTANDKSARTRPSPRLPPVWIASLWTHRNPDGSLEVVVNGRRLMLKPHLGALFIALAEDVGVSDDKGIGYKTLDELSGRAATLTGGRVLCERTINKYIWKLRQELIVHGGLTADVIQSRYRFGRRLAIERGKLRSPAPGGCQAPRSSVRATRGFAER